MILLDTSAWVEFFRATGSPVCQEVDRLLDGDIGIADPVLMEVLAGARSEAHLRDLRNVLGRARLIHCLPLDYSAAALLYRQCRQGGETVRKLIDCLIAAVAIRVQAPLLHSDTDFEALARHCALTVHEP